jgi:hypothetical protein
VSPISHAIEELAEDGLALLENRCCGTEKFTNIAWTSSGNSVRLSPPLQDQERNAEIMKCIEYLANL